MEKPKKDELFTQAYWQRPPIRQKGDANPDAIYCAVGKMTTAWEMVEQALSRVFVMMTHSETSPAASLATSRAFGVIFGNAGRRNAVRVAGEVYLAPYVSDPRVSDSLKDILNAIGWASERRDDVVHGVTIPKFSIDNRDLGAFLFPPEYNTMRTTAFRGQGSGLVDFTGAKYVYVAEDIEGFVEKFWQLHGRVMDYFVLLGKDDNGLPKLIQALAKKD